MKASSKRSREGRGRKGGGGRAVESEAPPASPPLAILLNRDHNHTQPEPSAMPTTAHITSTTSFLGHFSKLGQHLADQDLHPVCDPPISTICALKPDLCMS